MIFCDTKYHRCYIKKISKYIVFFFFYQFQTVSNPLYCFVFVFTHWNDMKLSISQWKRWKIKIMFWENNMKPSISQWNRWKIEIMFGEYDMKLSIQYQKISIYDHFHSNFHKERILISNLNWYFFENCLFHIIFYRFLVPILRSCQCLLVITCLDSLAQSHRNPYVFAQISQHYDFTSHRYSWKIICLRNWFVSRRA